MHLIKSVREHRIIKEYPVSKQFIKFVFVGSFVTAVDFTIYFSLTRLFYWWEEHFLYANGIAFATALTISFFANKLWTFRNDHKSYTRQSVKFLLSNIIALFITQSILYLLVKVLGITDIISKPTAVVIVILWNFTSYKFWVFPHAHRRG